jgi:hypothetical protein
MQKQMIAGTGISFRKGGLHRTTGTPMGQPIPAGKMQAAMSGRFGAKGAEQARLAQTLKGFGHKKKKRSNLAKAAGSGMSGTSY